MNKINNILCVLTYHELAKIRLNTSNLPIDFAEMAIIVLSTPDDLLAFFPMHPFHFGCLVGVADRQD